MSKVASRSSAASWLRFLLLLALAAWALRSLVVAPFSIPSGSMLPNMLPGDYLFVAKWPYGWSRFSFPGQFPDFPGRIAGSLPKRGDVVIFKRPDAEGRDWVKRVIGLPGDTVAVEGGTVILNGKPLPRRPANAIGIAITPNSPCATVAGAGQAPVMQGGVPTCLYPAATETLPGGRSYRVIDQIADASADSFAEIKVPPGQLFLLGDNRDDSADSRFSVADGGIGLVPVDRLVGRAAFAFWSTDGSASIANPVSWFRALRSERIGTGYQP